jgi:hypothetical protein
MADFEFETRIADLESNQTALALELAYQGRSTRRKILDWIRVRLGMKDNAPPGIFLWITVPRENPTEDEPRPIKIFAARGKTK